MNNLQELETEKRALHAELNTATEVEVVIKKLHENEKKITALRITQMLERVNREQAAKREEAAKVWECEQPTEDITTNDGSLHKVKARKYPKLAALPYVRINFKDGHATEITTGRNKFYMYASKYEYNKPTEYTRPATFDEFLKLNSIQKEDISAKQFEKFSNELEAASVAVKAAIAQYDNKRTKLDCYQMQNLGLVNQSNTHFYLYEAKKGY